LLKKRADAVVTIVTNPAPSVGAVALPLFELMIITSRRVPLAAGNVSVQVVPPVSTVTRFTTVKEAAALEEIVSVERIPP
jgi:hypothetical protein